MSGDAWGYHAPVMVDEVLAHLRPERGGLYFDGTVGGGGHAEALLMASSEARLVAADRDPAAVEEAARRLARFGERVRLVPADFATAAGSLGEATLAGALLDLGVSSHQIDAPERGFTFREGAPLDMRMEGKGKGKGKGEGKREGEGEGAGRTAADVLNTYGEAELVDVLRRYGEEPRARRVAREIVARRGSAPFRTSDDLVAVLERVYGGRLTPQDKARVFQALRIEVNRELELLERALPLVRDRLEGGGVMVVLAYHSLEDRLVKNAFREWSRACVCPPELPVCVCRGRPLGETLTRRPQRPTDAEVEANPRARSARLRAWRRAA